MKNSYPYLLLKQEEAFTLLEVMVAIAILALTISMLFGSQSQSLSLITESQFNTQASLLAGLKIAEYECGKEELYNNDGDFGENFPGYTWKAEVESPSLAEYPVLEDADENVQQVELTIRWGEERFSHTVKYYLYTKVIRGAGQGGQGGDGS